MTQFVDYRPYQQVDETADATQMSGEATTQNQKPGWRGWMNDATKSLIVLWVAALVLYWILGSSFRSVRA